MRYVVVRRNLKHKMMSKEEARKMALRLAEKHNDTFYVVAVLEETVYETTIIRSCRPIESEPKGYGTCIGDPWSEEDDARLIEMHMSKRYDTHELAEWFGRTRNGIRCRLRHNGIYF